MKNEINFSFCIITDNSLEACKRISQIISTIREQNIPNYEVIIIGGLGNKFSGNMENVIKVDFDEKIKTAWVSRKKNEAAKLAKFENLVIMHDYFILHKNWYHGYLKIFEEFKKCQVCCNPLFMIDDRRDYADWVTWDHPKLGMSKALSYADQENTKFQYIHGAYFVVKKDFFLRNPLNEEYVHGEPEDVEWSLRIRDEAKIILNPHSYCKHNKRHKHTEISVWHQLN